MTSMINNELGKNIRLKRLLSGDEKILSTFLNEIAGLIFFSGEISVYDKDNVLLSSSSSNPAKVIIPSFNEIKNNYYEFDSGIIHKISYQEVLLGYIYVQKIENQIDKIVILSRLVKFFLEEILKLKVEKKELLQETLNNYREMNLLYKFGGKISSLVDFDYILQSILIESKNIIEADSYAIHILNKKTNTLEKKAFLGTFCSSDYENHPDKVVARLISKTASSEIVNDVKLKQKLKNCGCNINSILGVPLKVKDELYGVLIITSSKENYFKARDEKLIFSLNTQAAIAIENIYLEKTNRENKRQLALRRVIREENEKEYKDLITRSPQLERIISSIPTDSIPYLISGEHGVGKKLIARKIHRESNRKDKPFIPIDCAFFSTDELSNKMLFGSDNPYEHKKSEADFSYLELAEGGTLFLQNIDRLPKNIGEKLYNFIVPTSDGSLKILKYDVRIVAETSVSLEKKVEKGEFDPKLFKLLNEHYIYIPPLRERKKDITKLVDYYIKEYSKSLGKEIKGIDNNGYEILLSYNFRLGNVKELKEIIERACILIESDTITSEYLFLGINAPSTKFNYNLLNIKPLYDLIRKGFFPRPLIFISSTFVSLIFYFAFISETRFSTNIGTFLAWSLWWPLFTISFFFFSRLWCSICPINEVGLTLRKIKHFNLKVPPFILNNTHYFATIGFLAIIWAEEYYAMHLSGFRTGIILAIIISLATITNIFFTRHTWCRYICPLGYFAGTLSLTSMLELRSNPDICANKCKTHDCFKGNEKIEGCPMLLHLQFINSNLLCKVCLRCVRLCQNNSPKLNLRLPGWDISGNEHLGQKASLAIIGLLSAPFAIILFESKKVLNNHSPFNFNLVYWITPVIIGLTIWLVNALFFGTDKENNFQHFFDVLNFYIPIAMSINFVLQFKFLPFLSKINITGTSSEGITQSNIFSFSLIHISQTGIILGGFIFSSFLLIVNYYYMKKKQSTHNIAYYFSHLFLMAAYCFTVSKLLIH